MLIENDLIDKKCAHYKDHLYHSFSGYKTDCGNSYVFMDGDIQSNGYVYCPYCARLILFGECK